MKIALIILISLLSVFTVYFVILGIHSKSKTAPGLINGQLAKCPNTPNCVNTENKDHIGHYIAPINLTQNTLSSLDSLLILKDIVKNMGGSIQDESKNYFAATFTSSIFRFVDDLEFRIDNEKNVIHLRSASRVGRSDFGINNKRIKLLKEFYKNKMSTAEQK